jgi:hypothetical protein
MYVEGALHLVNVSVATQDKHRSFIRFLKWGTLHVRFLSFSFSNKIIAIKKFIRSLRRIRTLNGAVLGIRVLCSALTQCFLKEFWLLAKMVITPRKDLAKTGYNPCKKNKNTIILLYFFVPLWKPNLDIRKKITMFFPHFFHFFKSDFQKQISFSFWQNFSNTQRIASTSWQALIPRTAPFSVLILLVANSSLFLLPVKPCHKFKF